MVARPTNVSVLVGNDIVPVLIIVLITGLVIVLFVSVSLPAKVDNVPVVGNVTLVAAVVVSVNAKFPLVVNELAVVILPPTVIVFAPLLTPVPPYVPATIEPCHTPVPIVPTEVKLELTILDPRLVAFNTFTLLIS